MGSTGIEKLTETFDFDALRLPQNYGQMTNVKRLLVHVPVKKPNRHEFFRVHPNLSYNALFFEDKNDKELYLIMDLDLRDELLLELVPKVVYPYVNRSHELKLWAIRLPNAEGKLDGYNRTALEAAKLAMGKWIRIKTEDGVASYVVEEAALQSEPRWPEVLSEPNAMAKVLALAFKDHSISNMDHPVIQKAITGAL